MVLLDLQLSPVAERRCKSCTSFPWFVKCKWSKSKHRTVTARDLSNVPPGTGAFQGYLSIIYFQWVEFFGIFSEVLRMPRIASFLFIQIQELFDGIFFWWHLLQLVTSDYSAHTAPGSEHPVSEEMEWEKRTGISYSSAISHWHTINFMEHTHLSVIEGNQQRSHHMPKNWRKNAQC